MKKKSPKQLLGLPRFSEDTEVRFFAPDTQAALGGEKLEYATATLTKVFDGPSGHKAKLYPAFARSPEDRPTGCCAAEVPRHLEEWEDTCEEIAELMGQARHSMLWCAAW